MHLTVCSHQSVYSLQSMPCQHKVCSALHKFIVDQYSALIIINAHLICNERLYYNKVQLQASLFNVTQWIAQCLMEPSNCYNVTIAWFHKALCNPLWHHQQNVNNASETWPGCVTKSAPEKCGSYFKFVIFKLILHGSIRHCAIHCDIINRM